MKISSGQGSHDDISREKARGYAATNAVLPGLGTLTAGKKIGILQLALCLGGFGITLAFGVKFIFWALAHWSEYWAPPQNFDDPFRPLRDLWQHARWTLLGIVMFTISWIWSMMSSRSLLAAAKAEKPA